MPAMQASCVAIAGRGLVIQGPPGIGKSSLALALIDRGATLVADDGLIAEPAGARLLVRPHPNTRGLIEVRNVGLLAMPVCDQAPVALVIRLDRDAPRLVEQAEALDLFGYAIPLLRMWPDSPVLAIRAELALERFGLTAG